MIENEKEEMEEELLFSKGFVNELFRTIIYNFDKFKNNASEYLIETFNSLNHYDINPKNIIEFIQNHQKHDSWFSSLNGIFHQHGIGGCEIDRNKCLNLYLLAIRQEESLKLIEFDINN